MTATAARTWEEIAPGVHAWIHGTGDWGESNAGLVVGAGEEVLLVDTQWDETATARMLHAAPLPPGTAIGTLVNTHPDGDHVWGNAVPQAARIISTDAAAAAFDHEDPQRFARLVGLAKRTSPLPLLRLPVVGAQVAQLQLLTRYLAAMGDGWDYAAVRLTPPTDTFTGELELKIGGRAVRLVEVGPAHSHGDLVVHLPDDGIVFAGDILFVGVCPIAWVGPISNWLAALDTLDDLGAEIVVPGHGPVSGPAEVQTMREYLQWVVEVGERQRGSGDPIPKAAAAALRSREYARSPWADWISPERLIVTLDALEREADERPPVSTNAERAKLVGQMAVLADRRASGR